MLAVSREAHGGSVPRGAVVGPAGGRGGLVTGEHGATIAGLALALGSALGTNVAFLFKQRGAVLAPAVRARHPLRSAEGRRAI